MTELVYVLVLETRFWEFESPPGHQTFNKGETYDNIVLRYRIGIINDFKETTTVVDFQKYGIVEILDAFQVGGQHRGYQVKEDAIHIFLNFKKVAVVKSRSEAVSTIRKLIQGCPAEAKSTFDEYEEILFRDVRE